MGAAMGHMPPKGAHCKLHWIWTVSPLQPVSVYGLIDDRSMIRQCHWWAESNDGALVMCTQSTRLADFPKYASNSIIGP